VSPKAVRTGVGASVFLASRAAAVQTGLTNIEAFIAKDNVIAQAYYERMGFETYRETAAAVCKVFRL